MTVRLTTTIAVFLLALPLPGGTGSASADERESMAVSPPQLWRTRPVRRDGPLREENITDREVRQIEALIREMFPGSIVYISAVTVGCPCQDGASCEAQVWTVANRGESARELALSKINDDWEVGPLQEWWLIRDRIVDLFSRSRNHPDASKRIDFQEYLQRMADHYEAFPICSDTPDAADDATTGQRRAGDRSPTTGLPEAGVAPEEF